MKLFFFATALFLSFADANPKNRCRINSIHKYTSKTCSENSKIATNGVDEPFIKAINKGLEENSCEKVDASGDVAVPP